MSWIVEISLKFRLLVVAVAAGMLLLCITTLRGMPVDVLPEFSPPYVEIQTEALGLSAEEVEQMITVPLEQDLLNGVAWLDSIRSESVPGLSSIVLTFQPETDLYRARQMVGERLTQAFALPHVSKPPTMLQPKSSTKRVMMAALSSKTVTPIDLSVLARWTVAPRLMGVPGVSNVSIWGLRDRQLQVQVDPRRLRDNNVSLLQIMETTGNAMWVSSLSFVEASTPGTGGFIETNTQRLGVRHIFPIRSARDLAQVPVEGTALRLGDVANVVEDHQPLIGDAVGSDNAALMLVIEKLPGANTLAVTQGVEKALTAMQPGLPGVDINPSIYRPATYIEQAIDNVSRFVLLASLLAALSLGLFLFEWRSVLIALIAVPLSLAAGVVVLQLRGASMNAIVLAGLAVAVVVVIHDALLGVGAVARRLQEQATQSSVRPKAVVILDATLESRNPLVYATLIVVVAVLPLFFIGGTTGSFFVPLGISFALAVLASMLVALTVTPALCLLLMSGAPAERRASPVVSAFQRGYGVVLWSVLRRPAPTFATVAILLVLGVVGVVMLKPSFTPRFKEQDLLVRLQAAPGTSQPEMNRLVARARSELSAIPGVRNVGAHVGRAVLSDTTAAVYSGELWVSLDKTAEYEATLTAIEQAVDGYPGVDQTVRGYLQERSTSVAAAAENALTVRVYGENPDTLRKAAEDVQRAIAGVTGVTGARVLLPVEQPTLEVQVDLGVAQKYGLKPGDVRRAAATLLSGIQVGSLFDAQKVFDVVVWGTPEVRSSLSSMRELLIDSPTGQQVRLGDVAQLRIAPAATAVRHDGSRTYLDVRADVGGRSLDSVAGDIDQRIQGIRFPLEYHAEVLGSYADREAGQNRILALSVAALLGIFLLLQAAFGSWRLAALVLVALPSAMSGGILVALVIGGSLSLGVLLGLLAVFAVAVRNALILILRQQQLDRAGDAPPGAEIIHRAAQEQALAVIATAVTTALAVSTVLLLGDVPGLEILRPMAGVVLGGLVTSTLLSLFAIPALHWRFRTTPRPILLGAPAVQLQYAGAGDAAD
jgi:CzcA family heavy metal efflux pump